MAERKIQITKSVTDKDTKQKLSVNQIISKPKARAQKFVDLGYAKFVDEKDSDDNEMSVKELGEFVSGVDSVDQLNDLLDQENARSQGARKGALKAIEDRLDDLASEGDQDEE